MLNETVDPAHTSPGPAIAAGDGLTVTIVEVAHPVGKVYVMVVVPTATPDTTPEEVPMVAADVLLLLHAPPAVELVNEKGAPTHALALPVIAPGSGLIVTVADAEHPVLNA